MLKCQNQVLGWLHYANRSFCIAKLFALIAKVLVFFHKLFTRTIKVQQCLHGIVCCIDIRVILIFAVPIDTTLFWKGELKITESINIDTFGATA